MICYNRKDNLDKLVATFAKLETGGQVGVWREMDHVESIRIPQVQDLFYIE